MPTPIGTRQIMAQTSAERDGVSGAWLRQKYKPTLTAIIVALRWVYTFDAVKRFDTLSYASQMRIKAFCGVSVYTFHAGISARQRARESVARRKMLQSSTVLNFHALRQRTQAIQPIIYRCHELSLQRIDLAITSQSSHWTISSWRRSRKAHVIAIKVQS